MNKACRIVSLPALAAAFFAAAVCPAQTVSILHVFSGTDGASPYGKLVQASDGTLYGTTTYTTGAGGAAGGSGTVFSITPSGTFTSLHTFTGTSPPVAGLVLGTDGNLYGSTGYDCDQGGLLLDSLPLTGSGSVFRITPSGAFTTLQSFPHLPVGALSESLDGNFFVPTATALYKMTPEGALTLLHSFGASEGWNLCQVTEAGDGEIYGTTNGGGADNNNIASGGGTAFQLALDGALTVFQSFQGPLFDPPPDGPCLDVENAPGAAPVGGLTLAPDGSYYGLLYCGIQSEAGAAMVLSPAGSVTQLASLFFPLRPPESSVLIIPSGSLTVGTDGKLYGLLSQDGDEGGGAVFSVTTAGVVDIVYLFAPPNISPQGGIIQGSDGYFYGATSGDHTGHYGTVYKLTPLPSSPTGVTATPANGSVTLSWTAVPTAATYEVFLGTSAGGEAKTASRTGITGTTETITGFGNGMTYYFIVAAVNAAGTGVSSTEVHAEPMSPPSTGGSGGGSWGVYDSVLLALLAASRARRVRAFVERRTRSR